jgi:OOP family OmpA-OmpF porin
VKRTLLATVISSLSLGAIADDAYYVTFGAAHTDTEVTKDYFDDYMKHSYDLELSAGYMFNEDTAIELSIVQPSPEQVDGRADVEQARLSGLYFFGYNTLKPYISAGVGYGKVSTDGGAVENALLSLGYGVQVAVTDNFFARAEVRYDDMVNEVVEHNNYVLEAGYRFGTQTTASDYSSANNMTDEADKAKADAQAKADAAKAATEKAKADAMAKAKAEAAKAAAAAKLDSDKDGVVNTADKCENTPANTSVDADGCPEFKGSLQGVFFETSSARLTESSKTILDNAAAELKRYPNIAVEVQAFTDSRGSDALNQKISQERANSVRTYLLNKGVDANKVTAKGYGEANPVASNETVEGRAANRRVELSVKK